MAKQLNRGQDGAGLATIKLNPEFGKRYVARKRSNSKSALLDIFEEIMSAYAALINLKSMTPNGLKRISRMQESFF